VSGEKIWDAAKQRDPSFTCAKLFWWFNMYSSADVSVTPRPLYPADGRKIPDIYSEPAGLRDALNRTLGAFPLFEFWGPAAGIASSRWIADSARIVFDERRPTLTLVYLPHLDYDLQRFGPDDPRIKDAVSAIDAVCGALIDHVRGKGARVVVLSEYGITAVDKPVHLNRALREAKLLAVRDELGTEKLDAGASEAFAVCDHQLAHVYVKHPRRIAEVKALLERVPGVDRVLDLEGKREVSLDHPRSGELVCLAKKNAWFTYYFWQDDRRAPDYARTVDIHRKPGYDPVELFLDPSLRVPKARIGLRLAQKTTLVKGAHGRLPDTPDEGPLFASTESKLVPDRVHARDVKDLVLRHLFG
jgi:predicted AlkP superfamily pyrophosphatase or phosphodiesterase